MNRIEIAALILALAGALIPALCILKMLLLKKFKRNSVLTTATITQSEKRTGLKGAVYYLLTISYKDYAEHVFTGTAIGSKKSIPGNAIPIMYKTDDPKKYKTDFGKYLPALLVFSLIFFALILWFCYWLLTTSYYVHPA